MVFTRRQLANLGQDTSPEGKPPKKDSKKQAPFKRKLFNTCGELKLCGEVEELPKSTEAMAPGSIELMGSQPSTPPTPKTVDRERSQTKSPTCFLLHPSLEPAMVYALQRWRDNLVALQPKVQVSDATLLGAMAIMREFAAIRPDLSVTLHNSAPHLFTYTGAAMWLVSKTSDVRTAIPNRTLMSQACQIHPQALADFEMDLCLSLKWEVTKVLRVHNLLL